MTGLLGLLALAQVLLALRVIVRFVATAGGKRIAACADPSPDRVSILLPVLDEESRVGRCLEGAMAQPEEVAEIWVVDGGSRDGTRAVVDGFAARDPRIRWLDASPVPASWTGKAWGLSAGLRASGRTDWILCLDADVRPPAELVRALLGHARRTGDRAFSVATLQALGSAAEGLVHPALLTTLVYRFGSPGHATLDLGRVQANGQCFIARRDVLVRSRAFEVAGSSLCEDITVARRLAEFGEPVGFYESDVPVEVTMYSGGREAWRDWSRSLPMRDGYFGLRQAIGLAEVVAVQALPLPLLLVGGALGAAGWFLALEAALVAVRLGVLVGTARAYRPRPATYWLSPLLDGLVALRLVRATLKRRHAWRGRTYVRRRDGGFRWEGELR